MQYQFTVVLIVTIFLALNKSHSDAAIFHRSGNIDIFNLLLGLYKLNPLKGSNVYKSFSEKLLSDTKVINNMKSTGYDDSNDMIGSKLTMNQLRSMEKLIHPPAYKQAVKHSVEEPQYDIDDVDIEKFDVNVVLREQDNDTTYKREDEIDDTDNIFASMKTVQNEQNNKIPVTKLKPVKNYTIAKAQLNTKLLPTKAVYENYEKKLERWGFAMNNNLLDVPVNVNDKVSPAVIVLK